ncbi:MAG: LamG domain-containing protein, partial [Proteobacteria bacterium]|nr:LamG domain-containing protein [Pseudomonadota bacterium]
MLQDVKDLTASGVMKGLNTQYNFLALQKDQSPNMMDVKINYDGSIEKRLGTTTQNTVTITGGSSSTLGFNPTTSGILTSFEAYWNLNQTSGDRSDQVGTSVLQSYNSVNYASGIKNQSALFVESSSQYLQAASSAIFSGNTNFSYSTWFFLNSTGGTVNRTLVAKRGTTSGSLDLFRPGDITTGLVGYWKFNNDATDSSSNGNNLTAVNTPTYVANGNYWKDEYIADLEDGSSQYYTLADASQTGLDITGSFTIATWIKRESADQHTIVAKGVTDTSGYRFYFSGTHNPVLTLAGTSVTSTETIATTGKHIHLAVTFDTVANVVNFYQDGNLLSSHSNSTDPTDNAEAFRIGSKSDAAAALWDGQLKDVAMWNVALTPIQIKSLAMGVDLTNMAYRPNNVSTQPTHWWKLNEISGNRADSVSTGPVTLTDNNSVLSSGGYIEGVGADFERANTESLEAADSAD